MSRRFFFVALALFMSLSACMPGLSPISASDAQATTVALARTQAAQTLISLPSPTILPTNTPLPTSTQTAAPTATPAPSETTTAAPNTTGTASPQATSTMGTASVTGTVTASTATAATATVTATISGTFTATNTPTPGPLLWGTVPPEVPFGFVTLKNLTNDMVYISFHCTLQSGLTSYLEFPVYSTLKVKIPSGPCHYVAWVKGQQFTGDIHIKKYEEYTFTFKPKKVWYTQP